LKTSPIKNWSLRNKKFAEKLLDEKDQIQKTIFLKGACLKWQPTPTQTNIE
jgi:hypothetical protein